MKRAGRLALALALAFGGMLAAAAPAAAQSSSSDPSSSEPPPVAYVRICSLYGAGFYYIPGTDTCTNPVNGDTRRATAYGVVRTWSPLVLQLMEDTEAANRAIEAAAVTVAIPMPIILTGDRFALAGNWAQLAGYHAFGLAGAFTIGNAFSINAGVGVGLETLTVGTRFGLNLNW
jgi:hypothetical protein